MSIAATDIKEGFRFSLVSHHRNEEGGRDFGGLYLTKIVADTQIEAWFGALLSEPEKLPVEGIPTPEAIAAFETTSEEDRRTFKDALPAWVPATFSSGRRTIETCVERRIVGHDFDHLVADTFEDAVERIKAMLPCRYLAIHTSPSERGSDGTWKVRVYEILDRPATPDEWESHVKPYMRSLGEHDKQALDLARLFFLPVRTSGYRFAVVDGPRTPLDGLHVATEALKAADVTSAPTASMETAEATRASAPDRARHAAATLLGSEWPAEGRHGAQLALAGALKHDIEKGQLDWTKEDALEFLCDVCRAAGGEDRAKREATIKHTWATQKVTGWRTLEKHVNVAVVSAARDLLRGSYAPSHDEDALEYLADMRTVGMAANDAQSVESTEAPKPVDRWKLKNGGWDEPLPPIEYAIHGLIGRGDVVTFIAHGNSLKTWVAYSMAIAVASGRPWLGRYPVAPSPGRVLVLDYESGDREVKRRMQILGVEGVEDRLFRSSFPTARLHDPKSWIDLEKEGFDFIVVDSFSKCGDQSIDENDPRIAIPLQHAARFAEETNATIVFIHHAGKGEKKDKREKARGSSAIYADVDWSFEFTKIDKRAGGVVRATVQSTKDGAGRAPEPFVVELSDQRGLVLVQEDTKAGLVSPPKEKTYDEIDAQVLLLVTAEGSASGYREIAAKTELGEKVVNSSVGRLIERGALVRTANRRLLPGGQKLEYARIFDVLEATYEPEASKIHSKTELAKAAAAQKESIDALTKGGYIFLDSPDSLEESRYCIRGADSREGRRATRQKALLGKKMKDD